VLRDEIRQKADETGLPAGAMVTAQTLSPEKVWLKPHLAIIEFLQNVPAERRMQLRGEDLLGDLPNYLRQICEWLGKRTDDEAIAAMMRPEESPFARYGPPNARYGNDPKFMESPKLRPFTHRPKPLKGSTDEQSAGYTEEVITYAMLFGY
jgi:hypothetical protein